MWTLTHVHFSFTIIWMDCKIGHSPHVRPYSQYVWEHRIVKKILGPLLPIQEVPGVKLSGRETGHSPLFSAKG